MKRFTLLALLAATALAGAAPMTDPAVSLLAEGNAFAASGKLDAALWAYRQAAKSGNIEGAFFAGEVLLIQGQTTTGRTRVLKLAEGLGYMYCAATNRHPQACAELANALQSGVGVPTNLVTAYAWLQVAAQRDPSFQANLDALVLRLKPEEILQAQRLSHDYVAGHWPAPVARAVDQGDPRFQIQGMTVTSHGSLIILNGDTLAVGETIHVAPAKSAKLTDASKMTVSCYDIASDHALIAVAGEPNLKLLTINNY